MFKEICLDNMFRVNMSREDKTINWFKNWNLFKQHGTVFEELNQ